MVKTRERGKPDKFAWSTPTEFEISRRRKRRLGEALLGGSPLGEVALYDPNQPRVPRGPEGGRWYSTPGVMVEPSEEKLLGRDPGYNDFLYPNYDGMVQPKFVIRGHKPYFWDDSSRNEARYGQDEDEDYYGVPHSMVLEHEFDVDRDKAADLEHRGELGLMLGYIQGFDDTVVVYSDREEPSKEELATLQQVFPRRSRVLWGTNYDDEIRLTEVRLHYDAQGHGISDKRQKRGLPRAGGSVKDKGGGKAKPDKERKKQKPITEIDGIKVYDKPLGSLRDPAKDPQERFLISPRGERFWGGKTFDLEHMPVTATLYPTYGGEPSTALETDYDKGNFTWATIYHDVPPGSRIANFYKPNTVYMQVASNETVARVKELYPGYEIEVTGDWMGPLPKKRSLDPTLKLAVVSTDAEGGELRRLADTWRKLHYDAQGRGISDKRQKQGLPRAGGSVKDKGGKAKPERKAQPDTEELRKRANRAIYEAKGDELFRKVTGRDLSGDASADLDALMNAPPAMFNAAHFGRLNNLMVELEAKERAQPRTGRLVQRGTGGKAALKDAEQAEAFLRQRFPNLRSGWNGDINMDSDMRAGGQARWTGDIAVAPRIAAPQGNPKPRRDNTRRAVVLHEMLHMFSPGHKPRTGETYGADAYLYGEMPGWEEAVVEENTRMLLKDFTPEDARSDLAEEPRRQNGHSYNKYIAPLEGLRKEYELGEHDEFWSSLMTVPMAERPMWVLERGKRNLKVSERRAFAGRVNNVDQQMRKPTGVG